MASTKNAKYTLDLKGFEEAAKKLNFSTYVARVGILGNRDARKLGDPMGNAEIGLIQEVGSYSNNIPARSWLRYPLIFKKNEFVKLITTKETTKLIDEGKIKTVFLLIGLLAEKIIQQAFATQGFGTWEPNSPITIALKGSSKPLIDTSQLRRSVTSEVASTKKKP